MKKKTFIVQLLDSKKPSRTSFTQVEDALFYSNDTDASLVFIPHEDSFDFQTAKVVMYNRSDESLVERDAVVTTENGRKVVSYELPEEIILHWGEWVAQPVFINGGEIYSGAIVPFSVFRYLMDNRPPTLRDVIKVDELYSQLVTVMDEISDKDVISAPEIILARGGHDTLGDRLDETTSQLAQKADKSEIGAPTQEQVNAWLEANPGATTTVGDGTITTSKLANKAVSNDKLSSIYNEKGVISSGSFNDLLETGTYLVTAAVTDNPLGAVGSFLVVETGATGILVQYVTRLNTSSDLYFRTVRTVSGTTTFYDWQKVSFSQNSQLPSGTDLNTIYRSGDYFLNGTPINAPSGFGVSMLKVTNVSNWVTQTISRAANPNEIYIRSFYLSSGVASNISQWVSVGRDLINRQLTTGEDLNTVLAEGTYLALASNLNIPTGAGAGLLVVKRQGLWINQDYTSVSDPNLSFKRTTNEAGTLRSNWEQIVTKSTLAGSASLGLAGKTVVNFGDSIFGNVRGASSVSQAIADNSGAEVINVAFGGAFASQRPDVDWNEMTFYKLSEAISSGDWSNLNREPVRTLRDYFGQHIDDLMAINWQNVDIITLAYGTNDFTGYKTLDNENDKFDVNTYGGAIRYGLRNIMTKYPHLKVLIITPIYRYYLDEEGNFIEDSDTRVESGGSFRNFVEKAIEVAEEFKVPYLNAHDKLGINKYNKDIYFNAPDTTHPNPTGNKKYGELIARKLIAGS